MIVLILLTMCQICKLGMKFHLFFITSQREGHSYFHKWGHIGTKMLSNLPKGKPAYKWQNSDSNPSNLVMGPVLLTPVPDWFMSSSLCQIISIPLSQPLSFPFSSPHLLGRVDSLGLENRLGREESQAGVVLRSWWSVCTSPLVLQGQF